MRKRTIPKPRKDITALSEAEHISMMSNWRNATFKQMWRNGYITYYELLFEQHGKRMSATIDTIFSRWVQRKKKCTASEVEHFVELMYNRLPGYWVQQWTSKAVIKRCGVIASEHKYEGWVNAPLVCPICGKELTWKYDCIFCDVHLNDFEKFQIKHPNTPTQEAAEAFINEYITKMSNRIQKGRIRGTDRTRNQRT